MSPVFFISMVLLRIPRAVQPMTGIEGYDGNERADHLAKLGSL